jgi:hypothetical protein
MKVIVAGSRTFDNYQLLCRKLDLILSRQKEVQIVCGEARGADVLGRRYAEEHGYEVLSFPAQWDTFGKSAGYRRNAEMAKVADALVAFWDGSSKGTQNMIQLMQGKPTRIIRY